ncbi:C4-dicarboxylate transport sensor protein dctB [Serratia fonticola]|jgi:two-component system C4-dicarboxylate transport sensor histidine kinase DctB|nr:C4-dicarboxylate transport sensor protein dctB [Serratia fonticola]
MRLNRSTFSVAPSSSRFTTRRQVLAVVIMIIIVAFSSAGLLIHDELKKQINFLSDQLNQKSLELKLRVKRYEFIPYSLSLDDKITNFLSKPIKTAKEQEALSHYLHAIQQQTGALAIYLLDEQASVIAASDIASEVSAIGKNLSYRPYFHDAKPGETLGYFGVGTTNSVSGYYQANGIFVEGVKLGVVVVKINLNEYLNNRTVGYQTVLLDRNNIVACSTHPEWFYHALESLPLSESDQINREKRYSNNIIKFPDVKRKLSLGDASGVIGFNEKYFIYTYQCIPEIKMVLAALLPIQDIIEAVLPGLVIVNLIFIFILILLYIAKQKNQITKLKLERQQTLEEQNGELEFLIAERTRELKIKSEFLKAEIKERIDTETMLRNTQKELVHSEKLAVIGQLSAGLAHEINQPLSAISMMSANTLKFMDIGEMDEARENIKRILRSVDFIAQLSNQLRTFSRTGDDTLSPVSIKVSIDNAMLLLSHRFKKIGCKFIRASQYVDVWCMCNHLRLEQVLVNLISNALDAVMVNDSDREIYVRWFINGDYAVIEIEDNGVGIAPEIAGSIFEPFFTTKSNHGLGLGLAISADIIKSYHGTLRATNGEQGACFILCLPQVENHSKELNDD